jgi:hypothetical protein
MGFTMPEVVVQTLLQEGLKQLRENEAAFKDIFEQYTQSELNKDYGEDYIASIWKWFSETKIPVVQAWALNIEKIPCISVHLANETEDEAKAAMNDYAGLFDEVAETGTAAFTVMIDIGLHTSRTGDYVLWLYYITSYLLFKNKAAFERQGLKLQTYSASDYNKEDGKRANNIWTRWIRFRCTTQNFWSADELSSIEEVNTYPTVGQDPSTDIATSADVDPTTVDTTANQGFKVSKVGDDDGDEDLSI